MKRFELRLDDDLYQAIRELATHERRSVNAQIDVLLRYGYHSWLEDHQHAKRWQTLVDHPAEDA